MHKQDVIKRLCALLGEVMKAHDYRLTTDCICGENDLTHPVQDGKALEFVEGCVREALMGGKRL